LDKERRDPMKRLIAITGVMLLLPAIFFVVVGAGADTVTKPIIGMWSGTDYAVGYCTTDTVQFVNVGKGVATELGKSDLLSVYCLDCTAYPSCETSGWMIVTAADGDALHLEVHATLNLVSGEWSEEEDIVGGTGRFKDATGYVETSGNFVVPTGADLFPYDADPAIPPGLLQEPTFWVATSDGWIRY
jgi:hypothetical protein